MNEIGIVEKINYFGNGTILDNITIVVSNIPLLMIIIFSILVVVWFTNKKNRSKIILATLVALLLHYLFTDLFVKGLLNDMFGFYRARPYLAFPEIINLIGPVHNDSSFPSGHMVSTVAVSFIFLKYYPKYFFPIIIFALFVAFCRIHNGVHYPTDILAGTIIGIIIGWISVILADKIRIRLSR